MGSRLLPPEPLFDERLFAARAFPANPSEPTCAFPGMLQRLVALEERRSVFEANGISDFGAEFMREQRMQLAYALRRLEPTRHIAAVIIAAKSDSVLAAEFQEMVDVEQHVVARGIVAVFAHEISAEIEAHNAAAVGERTEHIVGEIARVAAHGARVRMRRRERA